MLQAIFVWDNGMVMALDEEDEQIPELQGRIDRVWELVEKESTPLTAFYGYWPSEKPVLGEYQWPGGLSWRLVNADVVNLNK